VKSFGLFLALSWLLRSPLGRLLLLVAVLVYLDHRYFGLLAALMAPIYRHQRIASLRHAVEINPSDVRAMVELGEHYLRNGGYRTAAEYLEKAFDRGEDGARANFLLGAAWVKLGRHGEGRVRLQQAVALKPDVAYGEPYLYLIEEAAATDGGRSPRVDELVEKLRRFESVEMLTRAGHLCRQAGRNELARQLFAEAIQDYQFIPRNMRRRERRWLWRAHLGQMQAR